MKSEIITKTDQKMEFPCLMSAPSYGNETVLFNANKQGICVANPCGGHRLGEYRADWIMNCFKPTPAGTKVVLEA